MYLQHSNLDLYCLGNINNKDVSFGEVEESMKVGKLLTSKCLGQNIGKLGADSSVDHMDFANGVKFMDDGVVEIDML